MKKRLTIETALGRYIWYFKDNLPEWKIVGECTMSDLKALEDACRAFDMDTDEVERWWVEKCPEEQN